MVIAGSLAAADPRQTNKAEASSARGMRDDKDYACVAP